MAFNILNECLQSNRLQTALQNLLQCVVWFFHPRSSCMTHISANVFWWTKITHKASDVAENLQLYRVVRYFCPRSSCMMVHGGRSENNIKCVVHDHLGWKNQTTRYNLPSHWLYKWFCQFHSCRTYSVLSWSPSVLRGLSKTRRNDETADGTAVTNSVGRDSKN